MQIDFVYYLAGFTICASLSRCSTLPVESHSAPCHYLPGDPQWPSALDWQRLNASVGGRLIAGKPLAKVCHEPEYDSAACNKLKPEWTAIPTYLRDPVSPQAPYWQNNSCSPFTSPNSSCILGNSATYTINASSAQDVAAGIEFAKRKNIRLSVKNTGHDYIGRSVGLGSLGLWTHHLRNISFHDYHSSYYNGSAARLGAGVMAYEVYSAASKNGLRVVGGFCPTVGLAGGYVQGAGHGPLASAYGLVADNTLEFEVVTMQAQHVIASPTQNSDLYWALNGGGGGTYAVIISHTTKAHPDGPVAGASLSFNNPQDTEIFWAGVAEWQKHLLRLDHLNGFQNIWSVTNDSFKVEIATWPGADALSMAGAFAPFTTELVKRNITYNLTTDISPTYYDHYAKYTPGLPYGTYSTNEIIGGRLITRSSVENNIAGVIAAIRNITVSGQFTVNGIASNVTHARAGNNPGANAVLPAWRKSLYWLNMVGFWDPASSIDELHTIQAQININEANLKTVTPGSGAYMNEATFDNPDWKNDFYGANYQKLLEVKEKYDPGFMLYGPSVVGHDYWTVASDGRLCKTHKL